MSRVPAIFGYLMLLSLMAGGCMHTDQAEGPEETRSLNINLSIATRQAGNATDNNPVTNIEQNIVPDRLVICLYNADSGAHLYTLYDGSDKYDITFNQSAQSIDFSFLIPNNLVENNRKIGIAVYQLPQTALSGDIFSSGIAENIRALTFSYSNESEAIGKWTDSNLTIGSIPAFGYKTIDFDNPENNIEIQLIRALSKVEIFSNNDINIDKIRLVKTNDTAMLLPSMSDTFDEYIANPNVPDSQLSDCDITFTQDANGHFIAYLPEISEGQLTANRTLFQVTVDSKEYPLLFTSYANGAPQENPDVSTGYNCILRNSLYRFEIIGINGNQPKGSLLINATASPWIKHQFVVSI